MVQWELPRSRALPLLRSPAPYRHVMVLPALAGLFAVAFARFPALLDRAYLAEAFINAQTLRIDPTVERAMTGRWSSGPEVDWLRAPFASAGTRIESRDVSADALSVTLARYSDRVRLELRYEPTPAGALRWSCRVRPADAAATVDPWSVPAGCRE